jgi:ribosomal-protein-alanine N-acetyltransferase
MTEAIKPVLKYGFETLNLHRIEAKVADWNIPSIKLLLRSGFTKEGTLTQDYFHEGAYHDSDCYVLLRHEWDGLKNED